MDWARFTAYLRIKTGHEQLIAFDVYPREIYDETKTDVKIKIAPSLKFAAFEVPAVDDTLGEFDYLIVKKPRGAEAVRLTLDIVVDVITKHDPLSARIEMLPVGRLEIPLNME